MHHKCTKKPAFVACCDNPSLTLVKCKTRPKSALSYHDIASQLFSASQLLSSVANSLGGHHSPEHKNMDFSCIETKPNAVAPPTFGPSAIEIPVPKPTDNAHNAFIDTLRKTLAAVPRDDGNPLGCIADAILSLAVGFSNNLSLSATDVKSELKADFELVKNAQVALERRVKVLEEKQVFSEESSDLGASAVTLARNCEPYELVFSNMPDIPDNLIPDALCHLGKSMDVEITPKSITGIRRPTLPVTPPVAASNTPAADQHAKGLGTPRSRDIYVRFRYARLRDHFLTQMRSKKGGILGYPGVPPGTRVRCYEVLLTERQTLFRDIRAKVDPKEISIWHLDGVIKGRAKAGGKVICLNHPLDLDKFKANS